VKLFVLDNAANPLEIFKISKETAATLENRFNSVPRIKYSIFSNKKKSKPAARFV
jgi:hypothetical protein